MARDARQEEAVKKLCVPEGGGVRDTLVMTLHKSSWVQHHVGETLRIVGETLYWRKWFTQTSEMLKTCVVCNAHSANPPHAHPLIPPNTYPVPSFAWDLLNLSKSKVLVALELTTRFACS